MDDGSGLLEVLVWEQRFEREQQVDWDAIVIGVHVRVRGRLTCYKGAPQLVLASLDLLPDDGSEAVLEEIEHWKLVDHLNDTSYAVKPSLVEGADSILQERDMLRRVLDDSRQQPTSELECLAAVFLYLSNVGTASELELRQHVCSNAQLLRNSLLMLCDHGGAFWEPGVEATVTQIRPESNLAEAVVQVVKAAGRGGLSLSDLISRLRLDDRWRCARQELFDAAIDHLSMESRIFNDGEGLIKILE